jgi:hypothetical protein
MTVMMVVMVMAMMMSAVEMRSAMRSSGAWTGKYQSGHCRRCKHYRQFFIHVFLLFLSLLTKIKEHQIGKPDKKKHGLTIKKNAAGICGDWVTWSCGGERRKTTSKTIPAATQDPTPPCERYVEAL